MEVQILPTHRIKPANSIKVFKHRDLPQFEDWPAGRNQFMRTMTFTSYDHYIIQAIFNVEPRYDFASFKRRRYGYRNRWSDLVRLHVWEGVPFPTQNLCRHLPINVSAQKNSKTYIIEVDPIT